MVRLVCQEIVEKYLFYKMRSLRLSERVGWRLFGNTSRANIIRNVNEHSKVYKRKKAFICFLIKSFKFVSILNQYSKQVEKEKREERN